MTKQEVSEKYKIPKNILNQYEKLGFYKGESYKNQDLERLSFIMMLYDIGFSKKEVEEYVELLLGGTSTKEERMKMLNERRSSALDEIHFKEKQLEQLDYLRHETRSER